MFFSQDILPRYSLPFLLSHNPAALRNVSISDSISSTVSYLSLSFFLIRPLPIILLKNPRTLPAASILLTGPTILAMSAPILNIGRTVPVTFLILPRIFFERFLVKLLAKLSTNDVSLLAVFSFILPTIRSFIVTLAYSGRPVLCLISSNRFSTILVMVLTVV